MSKPKYKQGKQITSISQFDKSKSLYYKWRGKILHRGFIISWQYHFLQSQIRQGVLYEADFIEESEV